MTLRLLYVTATANTQLKFLDGQNRFLSERGFELHSVASPGTALQLLRDRDRVTVHPVAITRRLSPILDVVAVVRILLVIWRVRPHIVHLSTPKAAMLGAIAAFLMRVPARIYFVRGFASSTVSGWKQSVAVALERLTATLCHETVCVAPSLLEFGRQSGILRLDSGVVVANGMSNGVDAERFDPTKWNAGAAPAGADGLVIGFVGRIGRKKGIEELAEAWRSLRDHPTKPRLLLVGPWEKEDPISDDTVRQMMSDERVAFTGPVDDPAPYYATMSVFAFPSYGEGFPNAPMEAASMALPVVTTRVVGCVDAVVDGVTGTVVQSRDAGALALALSTYLDKPDLRWRHGQAGRARVLAKFDRKTIWKGIYQEYQRIASGRIPQLCSQEVHATSCRASDEVAPRF